MTLALAHTGQARHARHWLFDNWIGEARGIAFHSGIPRRD